MDSDGISKIIIMIALVLLSGFFSAAETAFSSLNRTRVQAMADKGEKHAATVYRLTENYDSLLSTILIGNNIVNIVLTAIATVFFVALIGSGGLTISTVIVTVVVLIFGEISPKTLAKDNPEKFAMAAAPVMRVLVVIMTPINFLFAQWKRLLTKIFKTGDGSRMTQDELLLIMNEVEKEGVIDEDECNLLRSAIDFSDKYADEIITHRVDVCAVPVDATREEVAEKFSTSHFSRILVYEESIDNIVGVIHQKDFYTGMGATDKSIREIMTEPIFVHQSMKIDDLLKLLQQNSVHIAVVSDEYGGTLGIVTMEDILEEIVGEIWDEHDEVIEPFQELEDGTCIVNCAADLDDFYETFGIESESTCTTIAGWVTEQMERIPDEGDSFTYENLSITVTKADSRRILELEVRRIPEEEENADEGEDSAEENKADESEDDEGSKDISNATDDE